jgi:hypothetical protein
MHYHLGLYGGWDLGYHPYELGQSR